MLSVMYVLYVMGVAFLPVIFMFLGGKILWYIPFYGLEHSTASEYLVRPAILLFVYVVLSGIFFIGFGYKALVRSKEEKTKSLVKKQNH